MITQAGGTAGDGTAELLLDRFGSLGAILATDRHAIAAASRSARLAALVDCVHRVVGHVLRDDIEDRPLVADERAVVSYLRGRCGHARNEELRILYLDTKNRLIHEQCFPGSVDEAPFQIREILRRGLDVGAASLILAHNHPSGDPSPSGADREITERLTRAAGDIGIAVLDHIIVTRTKSFSFRLGGLF